MTTPPGARPGPRPAGAAIPSPAMLSASRPARLIPPPEQYGDRRLSGIPHSVDATVGFAFAHVDRLDLLSRHYGSDLVVVQHVVLEWTRHAVRNINPLRAGATPEEAHQHQRKIRLQVAARRLMPLTRSAVDPDERSCVLGTPIQLPAAATPDIERLRTHLRNLPPPQDPSAKHPNEDMGECAAVYHLRLGVPSTTTAVGVLLTDDFRATRLAHNTGIRVLSCEQILAHIASEGRLGLITTEAAGLLANMRDVSTTNAARRGG